MTQKQQEQNLRAWHFVADDLLLYDGQQVAVGHTYRLPEGVEPVLCKIGYHASRYVLDALDDARGCVLELVELSGTICAEDDKYVASARTTLAIRDVSRELRLFACDCTDRALARVTTHGSRSVNADNAWYFAQANSAAAWSIRADAAASLAAADVAWDAAWDGAGAYEVADAAADAAWYAKTTPRITARYAAHAVHATIWSPSTERAWQRDELERRMLALLEGGER